MQEKQYSISSIKLRNSDALPSFHSDRTPVEEAHSHSPQAKHEEILDM
jgi:hypothetical protein